MWRPADHAAMHLPPESAGSPAELYRLREEWWHAGHSRRSERRADHGRVELSSPSRFRLSHEREARRRALPSARRGVAVTPSTRASVKWSRIALCVAGGAGAPRRARRSRRIAREPCQPFAAQGLRRCNDDRLVARSPPRLLHADRQAQCVELFSSASSRTTQSWSRRRRVLACRAGGVAPNSSSRGRGMEYASSAGRSIWRLRAAHVGDPLE